MRKVFYSFHYKGDAWRAGQVRNHNKIADEDEYGVIDAVEWEQIERQGTMAIENWINKQLKFTSVTVVLIGAETFSRPWVIYEIKESWKRGNAILGLYVHAVKDQKQQHSTKGPNPLDNVKFTDGTALSSVCCTYDWVIDNGRENLGQWVEDAYQTRLSMKEKKDIDESSGKGGSGNIPGRHVPPPPAPGPRTPPVPPRRREVG